MYSGILPLNKFAGKTSFHFVSQLRKLSQQKKVGHAGTLDPFATGVLILLIGKSFTTQSEQFLLQDKEYRATLHLGISTETLDLTGQVTSTSSLIPSLEAIEQALLSFQGTILQTPPMFSAKKIQGQTLYKLARQGLIIERPPQTITLQTQLISFSYPYLEIHVRCSKGTYIRQIAHDLGTLLGCGAHLSALTRTRSGSFSLENCCDATRLFDPSYHWQDYLLC